MNGLSMDGIVVIAALLSASTMMASQPMKKRKKRGRRGTTRVCTLSGSTKIRSNAAESRDITLLPSGGRVTKGGCDEL
jgi:hypothetical protein